MTAVAAEENYNHDIIVEALDKSFKLEEFSLDDIDPLLFKWELGGITDPIGQLAAWVVDTLGDAISDLGADVWNWLTTIRDQITSSISSALTSVQTALSSAISSVGDAVNAVSASLSSFITYVEGAFSSVQTAISSLGVSIAGIVTAVQTSISGVISEISALASSVQGFVSIVINQISALATSVYQNIASFSQTIVGTITTLQSWLSQAFATVTQGLAALGTQIVTAVGGIPSLIQSAFAGLTEWLQNAFTTVTGAITSFTTTLTSFGQLVLAGFNQIGAALIDFVTTVRDAITQSYSKLYNFLTERVKQLYEGMQEVGVALSGFINPLVEIKNWIFALPQQLSNIAKAGEVVLTTAWGGVVSFGQTVWSGTRTLIGWVEGLMETATKTVIDPLSEAVETLVKSPFSVLSERIKEIPEELGEVDILRYIAMGYSVEAAKQMAAIAAVEATGEAMGDQEVEVAPLGLGAKIRLKLGAYLKTAAKHLADIAKDTLKYSFAAVGLWTVEPTKYLIYQRLRNVLPVQLPTIREMIEYTRRRMPTRVFDKWLEKSREIMALRGFNDEFVNAVFTKADKLPAELQVKVKDRFGVNRLLPTSAVYDLPTASDFCRMMVRDIIFLDGFKQAMLARGMIPDIAKMYYLLHFRYPPLDKLFEFVCRCAAGFAWIDKEPEKEEDLGVTGVSPTALNVITAELGKEFNLDTVKSKIEEYTTNFLIPYAKWHDYAPFAYVENFTADRLINLDMMADVPMRIDGRWMYKWGIINEYDVFRIATARGMHPRWLEAITVAECMNALAEERTLARTGVINVFKEGFATERLLKESLTKLTTVKILGKDRDVKFLDGETKLLTLRAKYDRALDILRDYHRDLVRGFEENVIDWKNVTGALKSTTEALARGLGIKIAFDEDYYKLYAPVAESLQMLYTVRRIRYWLRYMMRTLLSRFERGYISKSEIKDIVDEIAEFAKMADEEKQALLEVAEMLLTVFNREMIARGVLRKLSRGVIDTQTAKKQLKELGLEDDVIDAMIEYHAKTYTLTLSQLISYMEYVPVKPEILKKKVEMLGIPEDEAKLIPAYAIARELSSEVGRYVTELITDYAEGLLTDQQLKQELDNAATLWGKAKQLGVDWVILSPQEREVLIMLAKKRRERKLAKESS